MSHTPGPWHGWSKESRRMTALSGKAFVRRPAWISEWPRLSVAKTTPSSSRRRR